MDKMTIEVMKAQFNLAMTQVDERLQLPIQRYVDALEKQNRKATSLMVESAGKIAYLLTLAQTTGNNHE